MECYIKLVGGPYLISTLQTVIGDIIQASDLDLEIDPIKVNSAEVLSLHRQNLLAVVRQVWNRIGELYESFVRKRALAKYQSQSEVIKVIHF